MFTNPPNVLFCGDPHGRFDHICDLTQATNPDAIVLLGDMDAKAPLSIVMQPVLDLGTEILWIPGNHDTDSVKNFDNLFSGPDHPLLHCIHGRSHVVRAKNKEDLTIAGLGGVFRSKAWWPPCQKGLGVPPEEGISSERFLATMGKGNRWRGGLPLRHRSTIFSDDVISAFSLRADVLVTHEAPAFHPSGFQVLHEIAVKIGASRSFHGHHHKAYDYGEHDGVKAFGVGIRSIVDLEGRVLYREALA